ncbi:MAG: hypothetical protein GY750_19820 [Lentisphaerae bacterium]|nr:hypothetical protein [Lentisphaerota bacterium]MCP4103643.1 hypothetical protein [Lentisphaerota bacterium]
MAGVGSDNPLGNVGWCRFSKPNIVDGLTWFRSSYKTPMELITSNWKKEQGAVHFE